MKQAHTTFDIVNIIPKSSEEVDAPISISVYIFLLKDSTVAHLRI